MKFRWNTDALKAGGIWLVFALANVAAHAQDAAGLPAGGNGNNAGGANAITQAAVQKGVMNCVSRINQVSNFLGYSPQAGAVLMLPPSQVDQRLVPLAMEVPIEGGTAYVSATFAPNQANGCGAAYEAVVYWPQTCDEVAGKQFSALKKVGPLRQNITVLDGGLAGKVFLMPAGSGCVSIKKEVVL